MKWFTGWWKILTRRLSRLKNVVDEITEHPIALSFTITHYFLLMSLFENFRKRQPGQPLYRILWWHFLHFLCLVWFKPMYRYRCWGKENIPDNGAILYLSNHQSYFDPILVGLGSYRRQFRAMARATLFDNPFFAWLIRSLNAIPVAQGESDLKSMRQCIDVLKQGHALLVFPEGERTLDGTTKEFASGILLLIKRTKPTIIPVALDGAFDVWPRNQKNPKWFGRIATCYGQPIAPEKILAMDSKEALVYLQQTVEQMRLQVEKNLETKTIKSEPG